MNTIGSPPANPANFVTPYSPLGRQVVGLESNEAKETVLPPIEQSDGPAAGSNRDRDQQRPDQVNSRTATESEQQLNQQLIRQLAARDREVRNHEAAHAAVGGQYAGAVSYTYQRGPNGVSYAVGGEVAISLPTGGDPEQLLRAAEQVRRAALAPAEPSAQDRRVAASASLIIAQAQAEIARQQRQAADQSEESSAAGVESSESTGQEPDGADRSAAPVLPNEGRDKRLPGLDAENSLGVLIDQRA